MRKVTITESVLKRIANLRSIHFSLQETLDFQIQLIQFIHGRLSTVVPNEGYKEYEKGPWANTRRLIIQGYRVYYSYNSKDDSMQGSNKSFIM